VRRLKDAALAVVRVLAVAAVIALIMLLVAVLGGLILIAVDELFTEPQDAPKTAAEDARGSRGAPPPKRLRRPHGPARGCIGSSSGQARGRAL
jgi:hypothetical protein